MKLLLDQTCNKIEKKQGKEIYSIIFQNHTKLILKEDDVSYDMDQENYNFVIDTDN